MSTNVHIIDAKGKRLGRVASEAASVLMGKNRTDFVRYKKPEVSVVIENAGALDVSEKKKNQKTYKHYTGYPGGLVKQSMKLVVSKKGNAEIIRTAIKGMLPKNRLHADSLKRLTIKN